MSTFFIRKPLGFRLSAAAEFYRNFTPGSGMAAAALDTLTLAFRLDGTDAPIAVALREQGDEMSIEVAGDANERAVAKQLGRILGLEANAEAWLEVGERDWVVGELQRQFHGFFSAAKASPYDAATWAVISPRMNQQQAARIKQALARDLGDALTLNGTTHFVFPSPERLRALDRFPGLSEEKVARLRGVAEAACAGLLDADRLREMGEARALGELQKLRGVGPWAASHIYFRGAAPLDGLPMAEPRILHGLGAAYRLRSPSLVTLQRIAAGWRPFRTWVCVLLMRHLAATAGWDAPGLDEERVRAGQALLRRSSPAA
ncbi:MAG TPA: hypothetical protein VHM25_25055 [Polyangiaceae bacterium]|jgi:DNA-3-methyladenine glycosylase II|nr:hypothetical protein [Polyangiaceae bacterium]